MHLLRCRRYVRTVATILRLLPALWLGSLAQPAFAAALPVTEVAPGVFMHQGVHQEFGEGYEGDIANIGFVIGEQAIAVIDTGGSRAVGAALREAIRERSPLPIRYVINTHVHSDHIFGNAAFEQDHPEFIGHYRLANAMRARAETYEGNLRRMLGEGAAGSRVVLPTRTVEAELAIDLGGRRLLLRAWTPAHTDHDLTVFDEKTATLWTGDLLFIERAPSIDGDAQGWLSVMDALEALPAARSIPGHGPVVADQSAAFARQRHYVQVLLADLRRGIAAGQPMQQVVAAAAQSERPRWQLFDTVNLRNAELLYPLLEWE